MNYKLLSLLTCLTLASGLKAEIVETGKEADKVEKVDSNYDNKLNKDAVVNKEEKEKKEEQEEAERHTRDAVELTEEQKEEALKRLEKFIKDHEEHVVVEIRKFIEKDQELKETLESLSETLRVNISLEINNDNERSQD